MCYVSPHRVWEEGSLRSVAFIPSTIKLHTVQITVGLEKVSLFGILQTFPPAWKYIAVKKKKKAGP